jgi:hypothetical protein
MKDEIIVGLKNAVERGYTIDQAVASMINAGYNAGEVKDAAGVFFGASHIIYSSGKPDSSEQMSTNLAGETIALAKKAEAQMPLPQQSINPAASEVKKEGHGMVIILVVILLLIVGLLISSMLFKDQILSLFG